MGELYEPFPRLPKNIRQIGERDQILKLYLEDYVKTYLKRLRPARGSDLRVGLLLGSREVHEDIPYVFVDGALEMESVTEEGEKVVFTEDAWKKAYQEVEQMFPKRTVQGWFLCGGPGCTLSPLNYWRQHSQYFTGKNQLMYLNSGLEGEEAAYIASADGFYKLRGYSIYYERNQMMQDYMILQKDSFRSEAGMNDKVIQDFKQRMDERKYEAMRHRGAVGVLTGVCSVLAVTVLAGGVAMFSNYQKLHRMESVIASVMPEGRGAGELLADFGKASDKMEASSGKGWTSADEPDYLIEEAAGEVYPTTAPADEAGKELPAQVNPETMPVSGDGGHSSQDSQESQAVISELQNVSETSPSGDQTEQTQRKETGAIQTPAFTEAQKEAAQSQETKASDEKEAGTSGLPPSGGRENASDETVSAVNYKVYTVTDGETLYGICYKLYQNLGHIDEICRVNALSDQNSIYAGQKLLVP
ncbi:MAG: LysM peptidoglycan-binding domain-containing protein [Clostridiaceae bacterium]|nr:LysM peptidoglycan-binding domain-containing protein [Clostridiaceae bacterium]